MFRLSTILIIWNKHHNYIMANGGREGSTKEQKNKRT